MFLIKFYPGKISFGIKLYICNMRLWIARTFIGLAFSLLLAHNLISHHHDEQAVEFHHDHHDHEADNSTTPFDNVILDGDFVQKLDFLHVDISVPVNLAVVRYSFEQVPTVVVQQHTLPPPEYPPSLYDIDASSLRGPPVYC